MGLDYVRKALLFDETDHCIRQAAPLDALAADIVDMALDPLIEECTDRSLEPLALLSERHDATVLLYPDYARPCWLTEGTDWRMGVARICHDIGGIAMEDMAHLDADPADFTARLHESVRGCLNAGAYAKARQLCAALEGYARTGLPGFDIHADPTARDGDTAIDRRLDPAPRGTRLIVEVALFWS